MGIFYTESCSRDDSDGTCSVRSLGWKSTDTPMGSDRSCRSLESGSTVREVLSVSKISSLPHGAFAKAVYRSTGASCAVRSSVIVGKNCSNVAALVQEVLISKTLENLHIHKLFEVLEDVEHAYVIGEHCAGGSLSDRLLGARLPEAAASTVLRQLLTAVDYMHARYICHRGISVDNLMLQTEGPIEQNVLKLTGFEFSCCFHPNQILTGEVGTLSYMAPEILSGFHSNLVDMWSSGVVAYYLLCGHLPFRAESEAGLRRAVQCAKFPMKSPEWMDISDDAKGFVGALMKPTPCFRLTARGALDHTWICVDTTCEHEPPSVVEFVDVSLSNKYPLTNAVQKKEAGLWRPYPIDTSFDDHEGRMMASILCIRQTQFDLPEEILVNDSHLPSLKASMRTYLLEVAEPLDVGQCYQ